MHAAAALRHTRPTRASNRERLNLQAVDDGEVFDIPGEYRQLVVKRGRGNQRIAHLQTMAQGKGFYQQDRLLRDGLLSAAG